MGKRGPAPTPTALKLALGNPGHRPINDREPKPIGDPRPPKRLTPRERKVWKQIVPGLIASGLASQIDAEPLARYCETLARYIDAKAFIDKNGQTYAIRDPLTNVVQRVVTWPQVSIERACHKALVAMEDRFGMSPSARSRISVDAQPDLDPMEAERNSYFRAAQGA